jgi:hypothetical protein
MNPLRHDEMGNHPLPVDREEIAAALAANEHCLRTYPYLLRRYGERGRRFGASDSGYLITVCHLGAETLAEQVYWLAAVLASRGLPRVLMEGHLHLLYQALAERLPARAADYLPLEQIAEDLRRHRLAQVDQRTQDRLQQGFRAQVGADLFAELPETPLLIASAHLDERHGLQQATASLLPWLTAAGRFPARWRDAVQACSEAVTLHLADR